MICYKKVDTGNFLKRRSNNFFHNLDLISTSYTVYVSEVIINNVKYKFYYYDVNDLLMTYGFTEEENL